MAQSSISGREGIAFLPAEEETQGTTVPWLHTPSVSPGRAAAGECSVPKPQQRGPLRGQLVTITRGLQPVGSEKTAPALAGFPQPERN